MSDKNSIDGAQLKQIYEGVFTRSAAAYDRVGPGYFAYFGRRLVEFARIPAGARVLDVACGRGAVLFPAVEAVSSTGEVIGADLSSGMVAETTREIDARGIRNARVMQMDAEHLQFAEGSFDFVVCGFALFFFPNLNQALSEIWRVLRPGGQIAVSTWGANRDPHWEWLDGLMRSYTSPESGEETEEAQPGPDFGTPSGMTALLEGAGCRGIRSETETVEFAFSSEAEWWAASWSHGGRLGLEEIERKTGADGLERFKNEAFAHLQGFKTPAGFPERMEVVWSAGLKE